MNRKILLGIIVFGCVCVAAGLFVAYEVGKEVFAKIAYRRGLVALEHRQNKEAVAYFTAAVGAFRDFEGRNASFMERGVAYRSLKEYEKALADLTEALREKPDNVRARLLRAYVHEENGESQLAYADYQKVLQLDPNSGPAWYYSGLYQQRLWNYAAARKSFREAIRCQPDYVNAYIGSANCSEHLGDRDGAIAGYEAAIGINPRDAYPYGARAGYWLKRKHYDRAVTDFTQALALDPDNKSYLYERSVAFAGAKNFPAAIKDLSRILGLDPHNERALQARGLSYRTLKDFPRAISDFTEWIRFTQSPHAYTERGRTYTQAGDYAAARADYEQANNIPRDPAKSLAWFLATCPDAGYRDGPKAVELATKACERSDWKDAHDLDALAAAEAETARYDEAVNHETRAIGLLGDKPEEKALMADRLAIYAAHKPYCDRYDYHR